MPNSYAPEVFVENKWSRNALRFATRAEAEANARDLFMRWTMCSDSRATEAEEAPNYTYTDGQLDAIEPIAAAA